MDEVNQFLQYKADVRPPLQDRFVARRRVQFRAALPVVCLADGALPLWLRVERQKLAAAIASLCDNHGSGRLGSGCLLNDVPVDALSGDVPPPAKLLTALKVALENPTPDRVLGHPEEVCRLNEGQTVGLAGFCHGAYLLRFLCA